MTLSEEIQTIVHAFDDTGRRNAIRDLAKRVAQREAELDALEKEVDFLADAYQDVAKLLWEALDKQDELKDQLDITDMHLKYAWENSDKLRAQRDELRSHFAYCTRGCDACSEGLELVKDAP